MQQKHIPHGSALNRRAAISFSHYDDIWQPASMNGVEKLPKSTEKPMKR